MTTEGITTVGRIYQGNDGYRIRTRDYGMKKLSGSLTEAESIPALLSRLVRIVGTIDGIYIDAVLIATI